MKLNYYSCSEEACKLICKYAKQDMKNIFIMNNGIDCKKFEYNEVKRSEIRKKYNLSNSIVIGHIGHFEIVKNHEFIIKLFSKLYNNNNNYKLLLIGKGSLKEKIVKEIQKSEFKNNVILLEERKDIPDLLNAMDCFIFPSKFEGLGIATIEAQACGLPTFISEGVPKEVIISNCTQLNTSNIEEWVEGIKNMKTNNRKLSNDIVKKTKYNIDNNVSLLEYKYYEIEVEK